MNIQLAVEKLFPDCTFEGQIVGDDGIEVLGLARAMVPKNCEVLASGIFQYARHQTAHNTYLVKADDCVFQVRVFSAHAMGICAHITPQPFVAPSECDDA